MGVHYSLGGNLAPVHESWVLLCNGHEQFPPLEFDFTPDRADAGREIPLPIPGQAPPGSYTLRLKASRGAEALEREFAFRVE